ncbi:hypothetical protein SLH46_00215 [Draconibacterium sp. IB214405]|uniref:hypothetical protein n=1 Tax=Draconibacterium sp. IB214405 TaxID=3097352 RepID=UPI002A1589DE|nr:hypothetical protein [Draconibacterium sp. IB214405]MDX8337582.1 hypothetical protein [Draconibacterium sp. IB214405]
MDNLEHRIKNAFESNDKKTSFSGREQMWSRLDSELHGRKGVAAFWRIAAVFLGLLLTLGVVASLNNRANKRAEMENVKHEITTLQLLVDSLQTVPAEVRTEVQVVETEKVVYRDRVVENNVPDESKKWQQNYQQAMDSIQTLQNATAAFKAEIETLNDELLALKNRTESKNTEPAQSANPFELKSERVELGPQPKPSVKSPEMEMKVFQRNFIENRNNLNSTIFKK